MSIKVQYNLIDSREMLSIDRLIGQGTKNYTIRIESNKKQEHTSIKKRRYQIFDQYFSIKREKQETKQDEDDDDNYQAIKQISLH